jgi:hypothetical protein
VKLRAIRRGEPDILRRKRSGMPVAVEPSRIVWKEHHAALEDANDEHKHYVRPDDAEQRHQQTAAARWHCSFLQREQCNREPECLNVCALGHPQASKPTKASSVGFEVPACGLFPHARLESNRVRLFRSRPTSHPLRRSEQQPLILRIHPAKQFGQSA